MTPPDAQELLDKIKALEASVELLKKAGATGEVQVKMEEVQIKSDAPDDDDVLHSPEPELAANLWSYANELALRDGKALGEASIWAFAKAIVYLVVLNIVQIVYAYGVYDVAHFLNRRNAFPAFSLPVDNSIFYPDNQVGGLGVINVLSSVCAVFMLAISLKQDTVGTLGMSGPLDTLMLAMGNGGPAMVPLAARCVVLQLFWSLRAAIVPPLICIASYATDPSFAIGKFALIRLGLNGATLAWTSIRSDGHQHGLYGKLRGGTTLKYVFAFLAFLSPSHTQWREELDTGPVFQRSRNTGH